MMFADWLVFLVAAYFLFLNPYQPTGSLIGDVMVHILCAVFFGGLTSLAALWPQRIRRNRKRKELLALPKHTVEGVLSPPLLFDTGKTYSVPTITGYSQEIGGNWSTYNHYTYVSRKKYDGWYVKLMQAGPSMVFRGLPTRFFPDKEPLPAIGGYAKITYVTEKDGTNYFVSAVPA